MPTRRSPSRHCAFALAALLALSGCRLGAARHRYCTESSAAGFCMPERATIERLIAQASEFHGRRVRVRGYAHVEKQNSGLYPTQDDSDEWRSKRGLWLDAATGGDPIDHLVEVEGTFDQLDQGYQGNWSGALTHLFRVQRIEVPED